TLYEPALALLRAPELQAPPIAGPLPQFVVPPNPVLAALASSAVLNLFKLRQGLNIAGLQRAVPLYAAPTDAQSGLPVLAGGAIPLPGAAALPPTPYRYAVLIERAKQLAQLAAQMEASLLAALEKRDNELYSRLKAKQDMEIARAGVRLQDLRLSEANDG